MYYHLVLWKKAQPNKQLNNLIQKNVSIIEALFFCAKICVNFNCNLLTWINSYYLVVMKFLIVSEKVPIHKELLKNRFIKYNNILYKKGSLFNDCSKIS